MTAMSAMTRDVGDPLPLCFRISVVPYTHTGVGMGHFKKLSFSSQQHAELNVAHVASADLIDTMLLRLLNWIANLIAVIDTPTAMNP
jgi:hypothetical protein